MTQAKLGAVVMTALLIVYLALVGERSFALIATEDPVAVAIGYLMLFIPAIALWGIVMELRFGMRIEKLGKVLQIENAWPRFEFELRPSGRPTKDSAQLVFQKFSEQVRQDENNWRNWFALGLAYDAAGDRPRARKAMRMAIKLSNNTKAL
jgi:cytochrome c-type biogenesis protein CcmH/NrfG